MLILETWIAALILLMIIIFGATGIIGWIIEGMRLEEQKEENRKLQYRVRKLEQRLAHKNALENIRVADEYYEESLKNEQES